MARYPKLVGRKVDVVYRAGDILLPASGNLVGDSGRSIFLEQSLQQRGQAKHFRWEIPYQYIVRIEENAGHVSGKAEQKTVAASETQPSARAAAVGVPGLLPFSDKPKTA
jgi:hypothetical protein